MVEPIVVLTAGRSGSSMIAGIFAAHGVWCGKTREGDQYNPKGYYENRAIKALIKEHTDWNFLGDVPMFPALRGKVEQIIRGEGYGGGPWLVKQGAQFYRLWDEWTPKYVFIRRPLDDVMASYTRSGFLKGRYDEVQTRWIVQRNNSVMDHLEGADVQTDDVVNGNYSSLEEAFQYCGLTFNPEIAAEFIDGRFWC
tara:strand:- start:385 stop:972 length:588 start_codon:yes stop_codon:yes gene_type:complete